MADPQPHILPHLEEGPDGAPSTTFVEAAKAKDVAAHQHVDQVEGTSDGATLPDDMVDPVETGYAFRISTGGWLVKKKDGATSCAGGFTEAETWLWTGEAWPKKNFNLTMQLISREAGLDHKWHDVDGKAVVGPKRPAGVHGNAFKEFADGDKPAIPHHEVWRRDPATGQDALQGYAEATEPGGKWTRVAGGAKKHTLKCGESLHFKWIP